MAIIPLQKSKFILMIGDDGVLCVPYDVAAVKEPIFAAHTDEAAIHSVTILLAKHPKIPVILLADMLAQDFRPETLPRLSLLDRPKLIQRRLKQAFPQARLTASYTLKSSRTKIVMVGLQDESPLFDWLERAKSHLPRIGLLPLEVANLVMRLLPDAKDSWAMLLSQQRTGGFRQIVTHKGELIFTRLTAPLSDGASGDEIVAALQRDIKASLGYLGRLGLSDTNQLRIFLLLSDALHEAGGNLGLPVHSVTCVSPHKTAKHLRLPFIPNATDPYSDLLYAGYVARKRRLTLPLMLPDMKIVRNNMLIKQGGMRVATAAMLLALSLTGWHAVGLIKTFAQTQGEALQLVHLQNQLAQAQQTAAPLTEPLGRLRQAIERQRLFSEQTATPWQMLSALGNNLGTETRLTKFDWQNDSDDASHEVLHAELKLNAPSEPQDREQIINQFRQVAQNLNQLMPDYVVSVEHYPFPATPSESVSNNTADSKNAAPVAEITIRRKP